ncbi:Polysaccharide deacetylase [Lutibacter agarilyticus]|uniref:Polysaccharide deacetylase n=2 Tax=Lutibacter agarilyticus TaxID=1109740 RepID=A0A238YYS3_9FLAO|nr:Polysaccharide deacetylase [Lutibacter agarilyticus]
MYHYVRPFDPLFPNLKSLHIDDFRKQLDFFESEYGFVSKADFINSFKSGIVPNGVVLTFDDGLSCHYKYVYKELKKRDLWGVFYIPTLPFIEQKIIDVHRIHILLASNDSRKVYETIMSYLTDDMLDKKSENEFRSMVYKLQVNDNYTLLTKKTLNYFIKYEFREIIIDKVINKLIPNFEKILLNYYLTNNQIKEMHDNGMVIGSHTVSHPVLSKISKNKQFNEINDSFNYLEKIVDEFDIKTFCYPYGGFHSFDDNCEIILDSLKCSFSFNVEQRDIEKNDLLNRKQALPRYDCNQFQFGQVRELKKELI